MTEMLKKEFSRKTFVKGGGAMIVALTSAGAAQAATGVTQERISLPSSNTEHAPHCARPQPNRGPCR